jgi:hypothetical protein
MATIVDGSFSDLGKSCKGEASLQGFQKKAQAFPGVPINEGAGLKTKQKNLPACHPTQHLRSWVPFW